MPQQLRRENWVHDVTWAGTLEKQRKKSLGFWPLTYETELDGKWRLSEAADLRGVPGSLRTRRPWVGARFTNPGHGQGIHYLSDRARPAKRTWKAWKLTLGAEISLREAPFGRSDLRNPSTGNLIDGNAYPVLRSREGPRF